VGRYAPAGQDASGHLPRTSPPGPAKDEIIDVGARSRHGYAQKSRMAYDEDLANRIRELLADEEAVTEKAMFGGLAFLLHGNMAVSASRNGGLLARIDPADTDSALARPHASLMEMRGRTMDGWITVAPDGVRTEQELASWVERSLAFVRTLPPKA